MTKGDVRRARKAAREAGKALTGELAVDGGRCDDIGPVSFSESPRGLRARDRWARRYDALNGAPEGDWDR